MSWPCCCQPPIGKHAEQQQLLLLLQLQDLPLAPMLPTTHLPQKPLSCLPMMLLRPANAEVLQGT